MKKVALKKLLAAVIIATSITTVFPMKAYADWNKNSNGTWNYTEGIYKVKGWKNVEGTWYFFDNNGDMKKGWIKDNDKWYFASESGAMKNGWIKDGQTWYFTSPSGAMQTGWVKDGDRWYFTNSDGAMKTGWISNNNKWYYSDSSGSMQTGIVEIDGKTYALSKDGEMLTGKVKLGDKTYVFAENGQAIGNDIPPTNKAFAGFGITCNPSNPLVINENNNSELIPELINDKINNVNNNVDKSDAESSSSSSNSSKHSHNHSSSGGTSGGESSKPDNKPTEGDSNNKEENLVKPEHLNPIITSSKDLEKLQSNAQYETIILNIKDVFEGIELKNIKAKKLIVNNANNLRLEECIINELEVNTNESKPEIEINKLSKIENVNLKSGVEFYGWIVKNIYVNTTESVDINCGADNIEILKKDSNVSISSSKEINKILVKEESKLRIFGANLKSLVISKSSEIRVRGSIVNLIEILENSDFYISSCKIDEIKASSSAEVKLNRPVTIEKITSLIDNENDKVNVEGIGTVKNIEEKVSGSIILDKNIATGNSPEETGDEKNPIITNSKDLEKLQSNAQYETIILNIKDVFEKVELKNIKTKKLIVNNANNLMLEECTINELEINANESKPEIEINKLSKIENVNLKSGVEFYGDIVKNIYVNTTESVDINCGADNIEILKKDSNVSISSSKEINKILVKEESKLRIFGANLKSLVISKSSEIRVRGSIVNLIEILENSDFYISSCKIDEIKASSSAEVKLNRPVTIEKITSLIDNENDKVNVNGYGTINSIYEKINGSVILGDKQDRSAKLDSVDEWVKDTELTTINKDLIEEESTINNENLILEDNDTKNALDSDNKVSEIKDNEVVKSDSDITEKNTNNINATSNAESKTSNTNVILEDNSIK
ncbi:N-acetylmuramoyl-L-alanine amidase family protein [Clostridium sp. ZBS18]|uniref:N-acetylmuramoyl-L-alanine amidase family protein n=1 Tax=Clostridium sp. ZBS18 TaxID=2949967 RepID=UPI00207A41DE|nr:N-acetylmuramoyl-L-alanine amidase family protein [Clostridium sp. ZBS18]